MELKLYDSELKIMEVLWENGDLMAGALAKILNRQIGWNRNTTYTVIKKLIEKGAIERSEPNFTCQALITKEEVQVQETKELIGKLFAGSNEAFLSAFISKETLSEAEIQRLKNLINNLE